MERISSITHIEMTVPMSLMESVEVVAPNHVTETLKACSEEVSLRRMNAKAYLEMERDRVNSSYDSNAFIYQYNDEKISLVRPKTEKERYDFTKEN